MENLPASLAACSARGMMIPTWRSPAKAAAAGGTMRIRFDQPGAPCAQAMEFAGAQHQDDGAAAGLQFRYLAGQRALHRGFVQG